jgi:beta-glucosidase
MQKKIIFPLAGLFLLGFFSCQKLAVLPYKNQKLSVNDRTMDLLKRMSLKEKISQMKSFRLDMKLLKDGIFHGEKDSILQYCPGQFHINRNTLSASEFARQFNAIQHYIVEKTRLGIPAFSLGEGLHGFTCNQATSFPQAIAISSSWDTLLYEQVFSAAAIEMRSRGVNLVLSPVIDLGRDPRWGRIEETYGEDPYLVSRLGMAAVFGFQGRGEVFDSAHVASTLKHFAGHGQPEGGRNCAAIDFSERNFRENHLYPFEMAVTRAKASSLMASYNDYDGIPNHINHWLLTDVLRKEWGFDGFVMSDGGGINMLVRVHHVALDSADAARKSVQAGIDFELDNCMGSLESQVKSGLVSEDIINRAVKGILRIKFRMGLFEHPYANEQWAQQVAESPEHIKLARKAAQESMVLLKNENNTLPFDSTKIRNIAVIGPNADKVELGGYTIDGKKGVTVLAGIRNFAKGRLQVNYAEGCKITAEELPFFSNGNPKPNSEADDKKLISEAVNIARNADVILLVLGENGNLCREAWSEDHLGDRDNLSLPGLQNELARAMLALKKPLAVLLFNGRPICVNELVKSVPALIEGWYLGQEGGNAVADVIFGRVSPSGKLSLTIPGNVGQLPCFYNHKPSRNRSYLWGDANPLFPFGFGLSYASIQYHDLNVSPVSIDKYGIASVKITVINNSKINTDEIVQLYIHRKKSSVTRPVQELKDFSRVHLDAGETKTVTFNLTPDKLSFYGIDLKRVNEAGEIEIMVGKSSVDYLSTILNVK